MYFSLKHCQIRLKWSNSSWLLVFGVMLIPWLDRRVTNWKWVGVGSGGLSGSGHGCTMKQSREGKISNKATTVFVFSLKRVIMTSIRLLYDSSAAVSSRFKGTLGLGHSGGGCIIFKWQGGFQSKESRGDGFFPLDRKKVTHSNQQTRSAQTFS